MSHPHHISHIEISTRDTKESAKFYEEVFGWNVREDKEMNYTMFTAEGGTGGGFSMISEENPAGTVILYINTDDLTASLEKVKAAGGTVLQERFEIPTVGIIATFRDLSGNLLALFQPLEM